jgi:DNA repair exonuclease SbcCD ATPase subunit
MKINIKEISIKNFLSVGNKWITIDFREGLFRVTGENLDNNTRNGVGKSSVFIDSLMFAVFGKPVRKINLSDIPNTINNKRGCEVKLKFDVENDSYMIHRGVNPGFLKLYEKYSEGDENLKNNDNEKQDSAKKYTQKRIDDLIKASFSTFSHILIMSNSYTSPFLDLEKNKKREIIESILGITIFGDMNDIAKSLSLDLKSELKVLEKEYELKKSNFSTIKENQERLKEKANEFDKNKKQKISKIKEKLKVLNKDIENSENNIQDENDLDEKIEKLEKFLKKNESKLENIKSDIKYSIKYKNEYEETLNEISDKPTCPICGTETNSNHVVEHINDLKTKIKKEIDSQNSLKNDKTEILTKIEQIENKITDLNKIIRENRKFINLKETSLKEKENLANQVKEIKEEKNNFLDLINEDELKEVSSNIKNLEVEVENMSSQRKYYEYIRKLLSNDGVKNYIFKKILKFWNMKVNSYLSKMNAEFSILFDEELDATIKSRNRDPLQYHSFSGGEKARIDVAILLSIIDISKLQNSIDLNVMVIDELLDGGLDDNGREDVLNLFKNMVDTQGKSIYVISHNNNLPNELFNKEITLYKKNGFTSM